LLNIVNDIEDTMKTVKIARPKNTNVGAIMQQMRDLKLCKTSDVFSEATRSQMQADVEAGLSQALAFDSFRAFQVDVLALKVKCEARIENNEELLKKVKSREHERKMLQQVADSKGVKIEDLNAADVVTLTVDLPAEVISLQSLWKRSMQSKYGVLIERPEGSKGGGKGKDGPAPKNLTVRGLTTEVSECIAAMKKINLKEQKAVTGVTPKQAAAIMGSQQDNARKLEAEFPGVFVHREGRESNVTVYGPAKEVAACHKHIMENLTEEPVEVPPVVMKIDKDFAKCIIGAKGATISKLEADTDCTIKVSNHQGKDEEPQATVKITNKGGDKEKQEKAKSQISAFLKTLDNVLVEAKSEAVNRLYDGSAPRPSKGKGKGKGSEGADPRFVELWNTSGLTCVKKANGVQLCGDKTEIAKWKVILKECLEDAGNVPLYVKLTYEQARLWSQERVDGIKTSSGATKVVKVARGRDTNIEVSGTDGQKETARVAIEEFNEKINSTESIDDVDENTKRYLTGRGVAKLREVEAAHAVFVSVDRKGQGQSVKIVGEAASVAAAKTQLEGIIATSAGVDREIAIEWDEGRAVIGKAGVTVNNIRTKSGVDILKVEEADGEDGQKVKKVRLNGTEEACDIAEKMIKEAIEADKKNAADNKDRAATKGSGKGDGEGKGGKSDKPAAREAAAKKSDDALYKDDDGNEIGLKKRVVAKKVVEKKQVYDDTKAKASFPSLGGEDTKRAPKKSAWNKDGKDEDGKVVEKQSPAQAFPTLGATVKAPAKTKVEEKVEETKEEKEEEAEAAEEEAPKKDEWA